MLIFILIVWSIVGIVVAFKLVDEKVHELKLPLCKGLVIIAVCGPVTWIVVGAVKGYEYLLKWVKGEGK